MSRYVPDLQIMILSPLPLTQCAMHNSLIVHDIVCSSFAKKIEQSDLPMLHFSTD